MKKILLCNDDGVNSSGILAADKAAEEFGQTIIVGPSTQQSGIGHAITLFEPLRIKKLPLRNGKIGYAVSGTPTDAAIMGVFELCDDKPDLCISGINIGYNLGKSELTTSGTLGAAMEVASYGIPTIAVSQTVTDQSAKFENGRINIDFDFAIKMLKRVIRYVTDHGLPEGINLLNLNIPSEPASEEIKITRLTNRMFMPAVETRYDPRGKPYYWIDGIITDNDKEGSDGYCIKKEQTTSLTPLSLDLTGSLDKTRKWANKLNE